MLQTHQIKKEPTDSSGCGKKRTKVCTCKKKHNEDSKKSRQVLVNFGLSRKKVFTLNGKIGLHELFTTYVLNEPAFSGLLKDSYVVFQEFNEKFGTWVDIDQQEELQDGAVLTAVFFPQSIERDDNNPGSIRKRKKNTGVVANKDIVEICLSDISSSESEVSGSTDTSSDQDERNENDKCTELTRKKHKMDKTSEEDSKEVNEQESVVKNPEFRRQTKKNSIGESHSVGNPESSVSSEVGNSETSRYLSPIESVMPDAHYTNNSHGRAFAGEISDQSGRLGAITCNQPQQFLKNPTGNPIEDLKQLCSDMKWPEPIYDIKENGHGFTCKVLVNDKVYISRHNDQRSVRELAAEKVLCSFISYHRKVDYNQKPMYQKQPYRGKAYRGRAYRGRYTPHR